MRDLTQCCECLPRVQSSECVFGKSFSKIFTLVQKIFLLNLQMNPHKRGQKHYRPPFDSR